MTPRSIRRAQERKAKKAVERKAQNLSVRAEEQIEAGGTGFIPTVPSEARLQANRANSQLSTGPKSEEGRAKVSLNAVKTALTGRTVLLAGDDAAEYECHILGFANEYAPVGQRECDLVQSIADSWWRLKRIPCLESALFAQGYIEFADAFNEHDESVRPGLIQAQAFLKYEKQIRNLQLQEARLFRRYEKERAELRQLQQERQQRELEALQLAAARYQTAQKANQPFDNSAFGFEFSTAEIEEYLATMEARNQASNRPKAMHAQAA